MKRLALAVLLLSFFLVSCKEEGGGRIHHPCPAGDCSPGREQRDLH